MITFKQFITEQSFNDDDYYVVDTETKKVVKWIGSRLAGTEESYIKSPTQKVMKGMRAKHQGYELK